MKKIIIFLGILFVLVAILFWFGRKAGTPLSEVNPLPKVLDVRNATYDIDGVNITLKNGQNEQKISGSVTTTTTSYFGNEAKGDVNGDNKEDMAFLLVQDGGGTGLFTYLATFLKKDDGHEVLNTVFLGDRIAPQNVQIKNGLIIANYADRLSTEPMTAEPSVGVSRMFKVENMKLVEIKGEFGN